VPGTILTAEDTFVKIYAPGLRRIIDASDRSVRVHFYEAHSGWMAMHRDSIRGKLDYQYYLIKYSWMFLF
jgi:hypothetical protein